MEGSILALILLAVVLFFIRRVVLFNENEVLLEKCNEHLQELNNLTNELSIFFEKSQIYAPLNYPTIILTPSIEWRNKHAKALSAIGYYGREKRIELSEVNSMHKKGMNLYADYLRIWSIYITVNSYIEKRSGHKYAPSTDEEFQDWRAGNYVWDKFFVDDDN